MADLKKAVPENVGGEFFVDTTCIDCDTCRQVAPETFDDAGEYSYVHQQPENEAQNRLALQALLSCPTGSIGTRAANRAKQVMDDFPLLVDDPVYYCGFTSPKSFGGSSYLIRHPAGNWLVDSPKFLPNLVRKFKEAGGLAYIFLTHSDDVGDVHRYAEEFGAKRIIHREELWSQPDSEIVIDGFEPARIQPEFLVIPTPGHSKGHCSLLYADRYLFTGDHLWWERKDQRLGMPSYYFWDKAEMARSAEKLLNYTFEWILPGHGQRVHLPAAQMRVALETLVTRSGHLMSR
ncbi:MAG TPA: MBL fold metallo-hydrolase [Coleofasciculaceae cyanobacterium]|jgi:glyoxylase-like metal-dependent hydrolase (beta-lactamase superfamily II)/ferredoxin